MTSVVRRVLGGAWLVVALVVSACALQPQERAPTRAPEGSPKSVVTEITTTVADLDASTRFSSEVLGASVEDTKELSGAELDSLLGTEGARVRVRRLRLGRERLHLMQFLEAEGAPPRADARSNDLDFQHIALVVSDIDRMPRRPADAGYWEVTVYMPEFDEVLGAVRSAGTPFVSRRVAACETCERGRRAVVVYDPDGHAVRLAGN